MKKRTAFLCKLFGHRFVTTFEHIYIKLERCKRCQEIKITLTHEQTKTPLGTSSRTPSRS